MKYVAYYRVSTQKQGNSGLGLESQRSIVLSQIKTGNLIAEYTEVESGKKNNRQQLEAAIDRCKKDNCTLIIAKLDRLSRNVAFLAKLMESDLQFVCCDMPQANKFTLHIFSALAEQERVLISTRTKAALAELKKKGVKLGTPANLDQTARLKGSQARARQAQECDQNKIALKIGMSERKEGKTYEEIALELNRLGLRTVTGKPYSKKIVHQLLLRVGNRVINN